MNTVESKKVYVVCEAAPERWRYILRNEGKLHWVYFGKDVRRFYQLKKVLHDKGEPINSGELINLIAREIRTQFINFDKHLHTDNSQLLWQTSDLAQKNPYSSDLFFNCCAYLAFDRILRNFEGNLLAFSEDWFLGWIMARHSVELRCRIHFLTKQRIVDCLPYSFQHIFHLLRQLGKSLGCRIEFFRQFGRWKGIIKRLQRPPTSGKSKWLAGLDLVLVTWGDTETFPPEGTKQKDTYFGVLPGLLCDHGFKVGYLVNPVFWAAPYKETVRNVLTAQDVAIVPEQCLTWKDLTHILIRTLFMHWRLASRFIVQGLDLTRLLREEAKREKTKWRQCWAMQYYYVGRFFQKSRFQPRVLIHPFENQPWEKALRLGIKRYCPEIKIVGYQHSPFSMFWLGVYPSAKDFESQQIPDIVMVLGPFWRKFFLREGYPKSRLEIGPALRFDHLFHLLENRTPKNFGTVSSTANILMAASIGYLDTLELTLKTIEAFKDVPDISVQLKFHPKMNGGSEIVKNVLGILGLKELPSNFDITQNPVKDLLPVVDVVLHTGTSVALEALTGGIPLLHVRSDLCFDMNTLDTFDDASPSARTPTEIRKAVLACLEENEPKRIDRWRKASDLLEDLFSPALGHTLGAFTKFLRVDQGNECQDESALTNVNRFPQDSCPSRSTEFLCQDALPTSNEIVDDS